MKYRLGLDVGTSSVGLVALELDDKNRSVKPIYQSVRIFSESLLPPKSGGIGEPKKAARRSARQQRRGHRRRARRLKRIAELGRYLGIEPETVFADNKQERAAGKTGRKIHALRAQAAVSEIGLEDLLRVFLKMGKRRGYYGGFKAKKDDDMGKVETGIDSLKDEMQGTKCDTLGQYLWKRIQDGKHLRLKEDGLFADRQMLEDEFNKIWDIQEQYHPLLKNDHNGKSLRKHFHRAIIQQRPHKSPAPMVGNCSLEPMLPRAPMAQPVMQAFRIEKQVADLRWGTNRNAQPLSSEQRQVIREQLQNKKDVKFSILQGALERSGCPGPEGRELNLARGDRESLTGDHTAAAMKRLGLLDEWNQLTERNQISVINLLADAGSPEVFDTPGWDKNLRGAKGTIRKVRPEIKDFIDMMLDTKKFDRLSKMGFDVGRSSYSIKALNKLVVTMREQETDEHGAIDLIYPDFHNTHQEQPGEMLSKHDSTGNTVVDVALGQVRREVNAAIAQLGTTPSEIIIELSRDMRTGLKTRGEITAKMRRNEKDRKWAAKEINEHTNKEASPSQITRFLLWTEQGQKYCPYCNDPICVSDTINGNETEYEHILPKSLTRIGIKRDFLVLAHKKCNQQKQNMTPWQKWGQDKEHWSIIERRAQELEDGYKITVNGKERTFQHKGKARQLLIKDFESEALNDDVINDFTDRQFQETAWIAKACGKWLRSICSNVAVSRGLLTAHLRRTWGLDTVIPEVRYEEGMPVFDEDYQSNKGESAQEACKVSKEDFDKYRLYWEGQHVDKNRRTHRRLNKRIDHRHHLIDALVVALTSRGLYQRMATHYQSVTDSGGKKLRLYAEPGLKDIRKQALELVRSCRPSHRPDRWLAGNMFKDNPSTVREQNEELFYAQRKKLTDLAKDEKGNTLSTKSILKKIENILPHTTQKRIREAFEKGITSGASPEQIFNTMKHPEWDTPMRRVLIKGSKAPDALHVKHGNRNPNLEKYLEPDGYAWLEFDRENPEAKPRLMRQHEAIKSKMRSTGPNIVQLYKDDTVCDSEGNQYVIRKFSADRPTIFLSPVTEAVADIGKAETPRQKQVSGTQIKTLRLITDDRSPDSVG